MTLTSKSVGAEPAPMLQRAGLAPGSAPASSELRDRPLRGIVLLLAALAFFSGSDALSKVLAETLPTLEVAWLRYVGFMLVMLPALLMGREVLHARQPVLQVLRGIGVLGSAVFFIMALGYLPMAEATAITFVSPVFVTALAIPLLGEVVGMRRWAAVLTGLVGVLIVVRPGTGAFGLAAVLPVLSAVSWAFALVFTRKMSGGDRPTTTLFYSALVGVIALTLAVPFDWVTPSRNELLLGAAMALLSTVAQWLIVLAYRQADASVLAPFAYSQLITSAALGLAVFGAIPDLLTFLGAGVIMASGLYTAHRERVRAKERAATNVRTALHDR